MLRRSAAGTLPKLPLASLPVLMYPWTMSALVIFCWGFGLLAKAAVCARALYSRVADFPAFLSFMSLAAIRTAWLMYCYWSGGSVEYRAAYLSTDRPMALLEGLAGVEALIAIGRSLPGSWRILLPIVASGAGVAMFLQFFLGVVAAGGDRHLAQMVALNQIVGFGVGLALIAASAFFGLPGWQMQRLATHGGAVSCLLLIPAICNAFLAYAGQLQQVCIVLGYASACFYWVARIASPQKMEEPEPENQSTMEQVLAKLERLG